MKRTFFILFMAVAISLSTSLCYVYAEYPPYKDPWVKTDSHLYKLIKDGYQVVGTNYSVAGTLMLEVIYVKKKENLYRCISVKSQNQHGCELLTKPKDDN